MRHGYPLVILLGTLLALLGALGPEVPQAQEQRPRSGGEVIFLVPSEPPSRALDAEERKRHLRAFEKRLLDEEAHYIYTLQWHRIVAHSTKVRGWTITPSHFLNQQLDSVWLAE